jgi:hypothetical protein
MSIPAAAKFKQDSNVTLARRGADSHLMRIDDVLEQIGNAPKGTAQYEQFNFTILYGQLYYATDGWLKERARGVGNAGRDAAVNALYLIVCTTLASRAGVGINALPNWLTAAFGRDLSEHGEKLDYNKRLAQYLSSVDREKFRIRFDGGIAQQMQWWLTKTSWQNADSERSTASDLGWREGHSGYALSIGGDFYSGPHRASGAENKGMSFFHSSYMAGDAVRCAGTWKIRNGKLLEITDSSGHYQPTILHMLGAIETLKGYGVNLSDVKIFLMSQGNPAPEFGLAQFLAAAQRHSLDTMAIEFTNNRKVQQVRIATQVAKNYSDDVKMAAKRIEELKIVIEHLRTKSHIVNKTNYKTASNCTICQNYSKEWPRILDELANPA